MMAYIRKYKRGIVDLMSLALFKILQICEEAAQSYFEVFPEGSSQRQPRKNSVKVLAN